MTILYVNSIRLKSDNDLVCAGADVENCHKDVHAEEQKGNLRSNSHLSSDQKSGNGFTRNDEEIQEQAGHTQGESSSFIVEEFDVERVLREQETHDLICPKCRLCITKRVILRKRKRTEIPSGLPPPEAQVVPGASRLPSETPDPDDTIVFRCLSCFSFFIPTGIVVSPFVCPATPSHSILLFFVLQKTRSSQS